MRHMLTETVFSIVCQFFYGNPDGAFKLRALRLKYIVKNYNSYQTISPVNARYELCGWSNPLTIYCPLHALSIIINITRIPLRRKIRQNVFLQLKPTYIYQLNLQGEFITLAQGAVQTLKSKIELADMSAFVARLNRTGACQFRFTRRHCKALILYNEECLIDILSQSDKKYSMVHIDTTYDMSYYHVTSTSSLK